MTAWIVMGPVNNSPLGVPHVFAGKFNDISRFQVFDPGSQIDIVGDQYRLAGRKAQNKSLVPAAMCVIPKDFYHPSRACNMNVAEMMLERLRNRGVTWNMVGEEVICVGWTEMDEPVDAKSDDDRNG